MFTSTTPQEFFNLSQDYLKLFPKSEKDVKELAEKAKSVYLTEAKKATEVYQTYQKAAAGGASVNEIADANKKAQDLMVTARFAAFLALPGAIFALPVATKIAKEVGVDFIPASVAKEFSL